MTNFFHRVWLLCAGFSSYRQIRDATTFAALKHLTLLLVLCALAMGAVFLPQALSAINRFCTWWEQTAPPLRVENGRILSESDQPFHTRYGHVAFVLDTTGAHDAPLTNTPVGILIRSDQLIFWNWQPDSTTTVNHVSIRAADLPDGQVGGSYLRRLFHASLWMGMPLAMTSAVLIAMLIILLQSYLFAAVAAWMDRSIGVGMTLPQYLSISIHAATPAVIVVTVYTALQLQELLVHIGWVYVAVYGTFLVGGANACRDTIPMEDREPPPF